MDKRAKLIDYPEFASCPFCGGKAAFMGRERAEDGGGSPYFVACPECGAEGPNRKRPQQAEQAWNQAIRRKATGSPLFVIAEVFEQFSKEFSARFKR